MSRPILIDLGDGPCEHCAACKPAHCDQCGGPVGSYENMGTAGFQSPKPHHWHLRPVEGVTGRQSVYQSLCLSCYRAAYSAAYPGQTLPASPRELT